MINLTIPGYKQPLEIAHLAIDFNGTLAIDGKLINGAREALIEVSKKVEVHVLTGNTMNTAERELKDLPCKLSVMPVTNQGYEKGKYIALLGSDSVISIGNGRNDHAMLQASAIGIIVVQKEGASSEALQNADIVCSNVLEALDLLNHTHRLVATLRS